MTIQLNKRWTLVLGAAVVVALLAHPVAWAGADPTAPAATPVFWSQLQPLDIPAAMPHPAMAYDGDTRSTVLVGEVPAASGEAMTATWTWDGTTWTSMDPTTAPPPRQRASMAFDPVKHQMILFGGMDSTGRLLRDTWAWNGSDWVALSTAGPPAREGAVLSYDASNDLVLFGGTGQTPSPTASSVPGGDGGAATSLPGQTTAPSAPTGGNTTSSVATTITGSGATTGNGATTGSGATAAASVAAGSGPGTTSPAAGSTATGSAATGSTAISSSVTPTTASGSTDTTPTTVTGPPATPATTIGTSPAGAPSSTGGLSALGDTWIWNGATWTEANPALSPPPRTDAAWAYDSVRHQSVVFGGSPGPDGAASQAPLDDTWTWDGSTWSEPPASRPPGRLQASLSFDAKRGVAVLFGGDAGSGPVSDTWLWDGTTWTAATVDGAPSARTAASSAYDSDGQQIVLFGGSAADGSTLDDTWVLATRAPVTLSPQPPGGSASSASTVPASGSATSSTTGPPSTNPPLRPGSSAVNRSTASSGTSRSVPLVATARAVHQGDVVTLVGAGFQPGALITVTFHSTPTTIGQIRADAQGRFTMTVEVPEHAAAGVHHFEAAGAGRNGGTSTLVTPIQVLALSTPSGHRSALETVILSSIALLIPLLTWLALSGSSRWRRRTTAGA